MLSTNVPPARTRATLGRSTGTILITNVAGGDDSRIDARASGRIVCARDEGSNVGALREDEYVVLACEDIEISGGCQWGINECWI